MTISKKLSLLVFVSTFFFMITGASGIWFNLRNQSQLHDYMDEINLKQNILFNIYNKLGFGNGIHALKNYLIRNDERYYIRSKNNFLEAKTLIHQFQSFNDLNQIEIASMKELESAVDSRIESLDTIKYLYAQGRSLEEIDNAIFMDESLANTAMENINNFFFTEKDDFEQMIIKTQETTFAWMLVSFFVIYLIRRTVGKKIITGIKDSIHKLINMADQINLENRTVDKPKLGKDEIGELGEHFYHMSIRLERNFYEINRSKQELEDLALVTAQDLQEQLTKSDVGLDVLLIKERDNLSDIGKQYVHDLRRYVDNMQKITMDFIDYAQVGSSELGGSIVDLNNVVEEVIGELDFGKHSLPIILNKSNLPRVKGEKKLLIMLFHNLLSSAIKYHHTFNELVINIQCENISSKKVRINVMDNGVGFDLEYVHTAFSPYEKLSDKLKLPGGGVGLSICRKVLSLHNSNFHISSVSKKGTNISFDLDLAA